MPIRYIPRAFGGTLVITTGTALSTQSVTEVNAIVEAVLSRLQDLSQENVIVAETLTFRINTAFTEANAVVESIPLANPGSNTDQIATSETTPARTSGSSTSSSDVSESLPARLIASFTEANAVAETTQINTLGKTAVTETNAVTELVQLVPKALPTDQVDQTETTPGKQLSSFIESNAVTEISTPLQAISVSENNAQSETTRGLGSALPTDQVDVFETVKLVWYARIVESNDVSETTRAIPIQLVSVTENNSQVETVKNQGNKRNADNLDQVEVNADRIILRIVESNDVQESVVAAASTPIPVDTSAQMLYDTVRQQYARIRAASTNASIQLIAMVYFPPPIVLTEHSVPGEIDVLLIGETYSQMHVLKTIDQVSTFLAAYP